MDKPATFWMMEPLRKYVTFGGRARRAEYWWYYLAYLIALTVAVMLDRILGSGGAYGIGGIFYALVALGAFLPSLAVSFRRLHDVNRSAWWFLIILVPLVGAIVLLVWFCSRGTVGPNQYGPDPLDPAADVVGVFS